MHLSPRERADFDQIVNQLRMEDAGVGTVAPREHSMTLLLSVVIALLGFTVGLAILVHRPEVFVPITVLTLMLGCVLVARKVQARSAGSH